MERYEVSFPYAFLIFVLSIHCLLHWSAYQRRYVCTVEERNYDLVDKI
jgi:hypothetical protein